jgi:hypothetical protein
LFRWWLSLLHADAERHRDSNLDRHANSITERDEYADGYTLCRYLRDPNWYAHRQCHGCLDGDVHAIRCQRSYRAGPN